MSKQIDSIKRMKYKQNRLQGKPISKSLLDSGYKETTALHKQNDLKLVKVVEAEIKEEFKASEITVDYVLNKLKREAEQAKNSADRIRAVELLGKYLAMFTDTLRQSHTFTKEQIDQELDFLMRQRKQSITDEKSVVN